MKQSKLDNFFMFSGEMKKLLLNDLNTYLVKSWLIFNTNYTDSYKELKKFECYFSYRIIAENINISTSKVQKVINQLLQNNEIEYSYKSTSKKKSSILKVNFIANNPIYNTVKSAENTGVDLYSDTVNENVLVDNTVDSTVNNTVNNTVENVENTQLQDITNTLTNTVDNTVDNTLSKYNSKYNSKYISIVVNSEQLKLINNKCSITGGINEQQQREIKNMDMEKLEKTIEKCNSYKSSYNINYLLQTYKNEEQENKVTPLKKSKMTMSERLGIDNLNRTQKYEDLEERLLKLQTAKRNI